MYSLMANAISHYKDKQKCRNSEFWQKTILQASLAVSKKNVTLTEKKLLKLCGD